MWIFQDGRDLVAEPSRKANPSPQEHSLRYRVVPARVSAGELLVTNAHAGDHETVNGLLGRLAVDINTPKSCFAIRADRAEDERAE